VLLSRNDVGFNPQCFSSPVAEFHQQTLARAVLFPNNLLTTATHDHKRGEDTRARIAVLSERAAWFSAKIQYWRSLAEPLRVALNEGIAPSAGDELILYQTLLGSWPLGLAADDAKNRQCYLDRLLRWQEKSVREAKLRSTWSAPNTAYETVAQEFLTRLLSDNNTAFLRADIAAAAQTLAPAGALNGLSQTLLRLSVPGVPDLYQGNEFWDFSLVDPDNRRPVDYGARIDALDTIAGCEAETVNHNFTNQPINQLIHQLINRWQDGHIKQWLINQTLSARAQHRALFLHGDYQPLTVEGEQADHVIAFLRRNHHDFLLVVVPRLSASLLGDSVIPHIPPAAWGDTKVILPPQLSDANFTSPLGAHSLRAHQTALPLEKVLANFPVNFLLFNALH
jgi:(1->4)-alpha-D-glucan 1-alpha-D-glucosylmutase